MCLEHYFLHEAIKEQFSSAFEWGDIPEVVWEQQVDTYIVWVFSTTYFLRDTPNLTGHWADSFYFSDWFIQIYELLP